MISSLDTPSYVLDCKSVPSNDNDAANYRVILIVTYNMSRDTKAGSIEEFVRAS